MKESREEKVLRYYAEGRVKVVEVDPGRVGRAIVRGSGDALYDVIATRAGVFCSCPHGRYHEGPEQCVHIVAVGQVVDFDSIVSTRPTLAPDEPDDELEKLLASVRR